MRTKMELNPVRQGNIGDMPLNARLRWGVILFGSGIVLGTVLLELHAWRPALGGLFIPFFLGANGIFMGLYRTCTGLAVRGLRDLGGGPEKIASQPELHAVRMCAVRVTVAAFIMATLATGSFMFATR
jgi:hypothetical protein